MIPLRCIISGGQTGADRGSAEAAHDLGLQRGGMAPAGWRAEDGAIPPWYRKGMMLSASEEYPVRTRANVEASGGTLILSFGALPLNSGSMQTDKIASSLGKPRLHIKLPRGRIPGVWLPRPAPQFQIAAGRIMDFLRHHAIVTLNVAGPRESREPGLRAAVRGALVDILADELGFGGR